MDFTNFFFGAKTEDPGYQIGQSLRFKGAQQLQRTFTSSNSSVCTFSCWVKRTDVGNADNIFGAASSASQFERIIFNPTPNLSVYSQNGGADYINVRTVGLYRDPSAWYHLVYVKDTAQSTDSDRVKIYINGKRITDLEATVYPGQNTSNGSINNNILHTIGRDPDTGVDYLDGYLADIYFIDGRALQPTVFGNYDENDVWTPRDPEFEVNTQKLSAYLSSPDGPVGNPENAFDGNESTSTTLPNGDGNSVITFAPATPIPYTALFAATNMPATGWEWEIGGVTTAGTATTSVLVKITDTPGEISEDRPLILRGNGAAIPFIQAMATEVGYLVDGPRYSDDLTSSSGSFTAGALAAQAFDGSTSTEARSSGAGAVGKYIEYAPSTDIPFGTLEAWSTSPNVMHSFNGVDGGTGGSSWVLVATNGVLSSTQTYRATSIASGTTPNLNGIRVDGAILVDGEGLDYGTNGFHLNFSDPNDVGKDVSGNGNHFVATGFNTAPVGNFSADVDAPGLTTWETAAFGECNPTRLFDGRSDTFMQSTSPSSVIFEPSNPIPYQTLEYDTAGSTYTLNGGPVSGSGSDTGWVMIDASPGTLNRLEFISPHGSSIGAAARGIRINGDTVLIDGSGVDYDLVDDSPTNNYATLNSLVTRTYGDIKDGNLTATITELVDYSVANTPMTEKTYWETTIVSGAFGVGLADIRDNNAVDTNDSYLGGSGGNTWGYGSNGQITNNATSGVYTYDTYAAGDVIGQAYDPDSGQWWAFKNGVSITDGGNPTAGVAPIVLPGGFVAIDNERRDYIAPGVNPYPGEHKVNFGQQPFKYDPPAGYRGLSSRTHTDPPVLNGKDHMQTLTGLGSGVGIYTTTASTEKTDPFDAATWNFIGTTPFSSQNGNFVIDMGGEILTTDFTYTSNSGNLYILLSIDGITWREVGSNVSTPSGTQTWADGSPFRYVRHWFNNGNSGYTLGLGSTTGEVDILAKAQSTFPYGMWWIKDRINNANHQLLDSVRGSTNTIQPNTSQVQQAYSAPAGSSVAWCWKAGGAAVANTDGAIASQVSVNTEAGFSIVSFTGNGSQTTVGHGLNRAPEMMMLKNLQDDGTFWVNCYSALDTSWTQDQTITLKDYPQSMHLNNTDAANTQPFNGTAGNSSSNYIAYCWHSVPGYSTFGTYTGNSNPSGAFNYCGFKPAWVMIKAFSSDTGFGWFINDTTRQPNNPNGYALQANNTSAELNNSSAVVDLLSNGFKIRGGPDQYNKTGVQYIWAAFAENPFSYPTTAR